MPRSVLPFALLLLIGCGDNLWGRCANDPTSSQPTCIEYRGGDSATDVRAKEAIIATCGGGGFAWEKKECDRPNSLGACEKEVSITGDSTYTSTDWFYFGVTIGSEEDARATCARPPAGHFISR